MKFFSCKGSCQKNEKKHITLCWTWAVIAALLCAGFICGTTLMIQQGSIVALLKGFLAQPLLILLNGLPVGLTLLLMTALCGNLFYGAAITSVLWNVLSLINLIKCESRSDPFVPADLGLIREAMNAMGEYQIDLHWPLVGMIILCAAVFVVLGVWIKSPRMKWHGRIAVGLASAAVFAGAVAGVYTNTDLYNSFTVSYRYNIAAVFDELGFPYCFFYNFNLYPIDKPSGYSAKEVEEWIADYEAKAAPASAPEANVILIMGEAFSDLSDEAVFAYSQEENPMRAYQKLAASPQAISGRIVVSNFGAGTANTEFDVMTGMRTGMISENATSAFRVVRRKTNSIAWVLSDCGYNTYFMHPGEAWFYNRTSVYSHLGIDDQVFKEAFDAGDYKGTMISDAAFLEQLESDLTQRFQAAEPLFAYTVTIQNHQAYPYSKYGFEPEKVPLHQSISDTAMETLSVYMEGVRDTSNMVYEFSQYLNTCQEPTLLVFFGDHRPNLGQNPSVYEELGLKIGSTDTVEQCIDNYATPYLIWANDAYCEAYGITELSDQVELPADGQISDIYLGSLVYDLLEMEGMDAYYDFLHDVRLQIPVICQDGYRLADGTNTRDLPEDAACLVEQMQRWVYYRLKDER